MPVPTKLSLFARSLRHTVSIAATGLFDHERYAEANPDLPSGALRRVFHYCRFGYDEARDTNQNALATWLLPLLINEKLSALSIRRLIARYNRRSTEPERDALVSAFAEKLDLNFDEYLFLKAYSQHDYSQALKFLEHLPHDIAFMRRYLFARRHMSSAGLLAAHQWSVRELTDWQTPKPLSWLIAAREIAQATGYAHCEKLAFNQLLLQRFESTSDAVPYSLFGGLWELGFPVFNTGSAVYRKLLDLMPEALAIRLNKAPALALQSTRGWEDFLNTQSINSLSRSSELCSETERKWQSHDTDAAEGDFFVARVVGEHYWRMAETDPNHAAILAAFKAVIRRTSEQKDLPCKPIAASKIFDIRSEALEEKLCVSYHTVSAAHQTVVNFKESALPNYFQFDSRGYSGWASPLILPEANESAPNSHNKVDALKSKYIHDRISKYKQSEDEPIQVGQSSVLIALQVPNDTVATLAHIHPERVIALVANYYRNSDTTIFVKAHPMDKSFHTKQFLRRIGEKFRNLEITNASIFDLLDRVDLTITCNSGVGIESMLHETPVITFGASEYRSGALEAASESELVQHIEFIANPSARDEIVCRSQIFLNHFLQNRCFTLDNFPDSFDTLTRLESRQTDID